MLELVSRAYRQRLALEWRAAVLVAVLAVAVPVVGLTQLIESAWLLGGVGALIVLVVLGLLALAYVRPVSLLAVPGRFRDRDVSAAMARVRHGQPVEPMELQAAAVGPRPSRAASGSSQPGLVTCGGHRLGPLQAR